MVARDYISENRNGGKNTLIMQDADDWSNPLKMLRCRSLLTAVGTGGSMKVRIIETETGQVVAVYDIVLEGVPHDPVDQKYYEQAWQQAVKDGVVVEGDKEAHDFEFC